MSYIPLEKRFVEGGEGMPYRKEVNKKQLHLFQFLVENESATGRILNQKCLCLLVHWAGFARWSIGGPPPFAAALDVAVVALLGCKQDGAEGGRRSQEGIGQTDRPTDMTRPPREESYQTLRAFPMTSRITSNSSLMRLAIRRRRRRFLFLFRLTS